MRFGFCGPRIGLFRPFVSFNVGGRGYRAWPNQTLGPQFVYVIEGQHGLVKVGISNDPEARRATLQTSSPFGLNLVFCAPFSDAYAVEQEAHRLLEPVRASGEWFQTDKDRAIAAVHVAASNLGVPSGFSAPARPEAPDSRLAQFSRRWLGWGVLAALAAMALIGGLSGQ